jgi:hypothetical protein
MSVSLSNCTSIFQLGFALNAIVPTLLVTLHRTRQALENAFAQALKSPAFNLNLDDQEATEFARFIVQGARGFGRARRALRYPTILMFVGVLVSFWGLWLAATHPTGEISVLTLAGFCTLCLFVFPIVGLLYEAYLRLLEDRMVLVLTDKSRWSVKDIERFRKFKEADKMMGDAKRAVNDMLYEMSKKDLEREIASIKAKFRKFFSETLRHPVRSFRIAMELRALSRREAEYLETKKTEQ